MPTTLRNVRVEDDLWGRARETSERVGVTLSDVVRQALEAFVAEHAE